MSKQKTLNIEDKLKIIEAVDKGGRKKDIALRFGISASSLSTILSRKDEIKKRAGVCVELKDRKRVRQCVYTNVDEAILKWLTVVREKSLPVSGALIKEKALEFAKQMGSTNFVASTGWLDKFKNRHGLSQKVISGESASVNENDCTTWKENVLVNLLQQYDKNDVFNADETSLFYKCLPNKTLAFRNEKCHGGKYSKERVSVMLAAKMIGTEKLKLLVIGKSKNPRCFKGVKSLDTDYDFNRKAWMTGDIYLKWLQKFDNEMIRQNRKVLLFVDNCPVHPRSVSEKMKSVKVVYLPPNTTSKIQPMDQGIIKNLKIHYWKQILMKVLNAIDNNSYTEKMTISLKDCNTELSKAWVGDVTSETISRCFRKAGFSGTDVGIQTVEVPQVLSDSWSRIQDKICLSEDITLDQYINVDDDVETDEYPTDEEIVNEILQSQHASIEGEVEEEQEDSDHQGENSKITNGDLLNAFSIIRTSMQQHENVPEEMFIHLNKLESFIENKTIFNNTVQTRISDFFKIQ